MKIIKERDIEAYLVKQVKLAGGEIRKVQWIGRRGAPDRFVMFPNQKSAWVELKAPNVKPEAYQTREHSLMRKMGQDVWVVDSFMGVDDLINWYD